VRMSVGEYSVIPGIRNPVERGSGIPYNEGELIPMSTFPILALTGLGCNLAQCRLVNEDRKPARPPSRARLARFLEEAHRSRCDEQRSVMR
jgi:hypothetical protein